MGQKILVINDECTDHSMWDTCQVEKMGCPGCNYFKFLYNEKTREAIKIDDETRKEEEK